MRHLRWTALLLVGALAAGGCQVQRYSSQPLGDVSYAEAFRAGRAVFGKHFPIESADAGSGRIVGRPKSVEGGKDRLVAITPARQVATMRIRRKGDQVFADVRVDLQRQDVAAMRHMQPVTVDNELPNRTPAEEAPLSADQDQAWQNTSRDEALERQMLSELAARLARRQ